MKNSRLVDVLAALAMAGSLVGFGLWARPFPPRPDAEVPAGIGAALAREILREVKPGIGVAVVRREVEGSAQPEDELLFRGFERAFLAGGGRIAVVQAIQVDPLRPLEVPPGDFFELIRKSPPGSGIVSLMGPPLLSAERWAQVGAVRGEVPPIVAFCPGATASRGGLSGLLAERKVRAAVVERTAGEGRKAEARTFDAQYRVARAGEGRGPIPGEEVR